MKDDTISRQAAIDEWKNDFKGYINALDMPKDDYKGIMEYIDELPSAQPGCEDAVSRKWLVEAVEEGWIKFDTEKDYNRYIHLVRDIAPPVTPKQPGWIPITERLPEEETIYLITFGSGHVRLSSWHKDTKYNHGFDNIETGFLEDGTMVHFGVTAWMPLPKPYREGDANG